MGDEVQHFLQTCGQRAKDIQRDLPSTFADAREYYTSDKRFFVDFCEQLRDALVPIMEYAQRKHDGVRHTYFFQFRGKIKAITDDINKKIARLRLGQAYSNEERDKKMSGFFKKFIRLIGEYVDMTTVYAVGHIMNRTLGKYQFKLNEKETEAT